MGDQLSAAKKADQMKVLAADNKLAKAQAAASDDKLQLKKLQRQLSLSKNAATKSKQASMLAKAALENAKRDEKNNLGDENDAKMADAAAKLKLKLAMSIF